MKNLFTIILLCCLLSAMLTGCGFVANTNKGGDSPTQATESANDTDRSATSFKYGLGEWSDLVFSYDGGKMNYSVYLPAGYDGSEKLPLITYIPDATYAGRTLTDLKAAQCPKAWITEENMKKNPCIFLLIEIADGNSDISDTASDVSRVVPIIDEVISKYAVDEKRLYLTGQSMGGIFDFAINDAYADKFAATVYVGCQPGGDPYDNQFNSIVANKKYLNQKFVYITSAKDAKAPRGQEAIMKVLDENGIAYGLLTDVDHEGGERTESAVLDVLNKGHKQNFIQFTQVADGSPVREHMASFQFSYNVNAIYQWLTAQNKE